MEKLLTVNDYLRLLGEIVEPLTEQERAKLLERLEDVLINGTEQTGVPKGLLNS